jgi:serine/threonine protein phosphatase PrpC
VVRSVHHVGHGSHVGRVRPLNEDFHRVWSFALPRGSLDLYAVADGMGGAAAGELASKTAIEVLDESFERYAAEIGQGRQVVRVTTLLEKAFRLANRRIFAAATRHEGRRGMGTTLTCLAVMNDRAYIGHVGDSRAYLVRSSRIDQLTTDHSWVEEQVAQGALTPEEAEGHEWRNLITRALGTREQVVPDTHEIELKVGDTFVLSSDGLHNLVKPEEILDELRRTRDKNHAVEYLIALANDRGGPDNITLVVAEVM